MSTSITYLKGDATKPATEGNKIIVHICNDIGGWGYLFMIFNIEQTKISPAQI